jgi:DNA repair photolyase
MAEGISLAEPSAPTRARPELVAVERRGPILRRSPTGEGVFGIDLTAGCALGCPYCHIRGSSRYPGEGRVLFDPRVAVRLGSALDALADPPRLVVLSPSSDPLPPWPEVRRTAREVVDALLRRGVRTVLMTRGRITGDLIALLASKADLVQVALGIMTADPCLSRTLEPRAASPRSRLRALEQLVKAGVPVEVRLEPLIPDLTDTPENIRPLFAALARAGARRVIAHHLFLHPAMIAPLEQALGPLGLAERLADLFEGGPIFPLGSLGATKHLPLEARKNGLARLTALGAEYGLLVATGAAQNPDLRRAGAPT